MLSLSLGCIVAAVFYAGSHRSIFISFGALECLSMAVAVCAGTALVVSISGPQ